MSRSFGAAARIAKALSRTILFFVLANAPGVSQAAEPAEPSDSR